MPVIDPTATYIHLTESGDAEQVPVDAEFWATIASRTDLDDGYLATSYDTDADFPHWEMHPAGDEIIFAASGAYTLIIENQPDTLLPAGHAGIVPRGAWHRLTVQRPGRTIFITPGKDTQHKPLAD